MYTMTFNELNTKIVDVDGNYSPFMAFYQNTRNNKNTRGFD